MPAQYRTKVGQCVRKGYILPLGLNGRVDGVFVTGMEELFVDAEPFMAWPAL